MTAPARRLRSAGTRLLVSPAWFIPYDDFHRRRRATGLSVALDRWDGQRWVPTDLAPTVTAGGALAYPGLGRRREPWTAEPELYRARFAATGYRPLYAAEDDPFDASLAGKEFLAYPYDDDNPPQIAAEPELVPLLPDRAFEFPPGTRLVGGVVRRSGSGEPVGGALVEVCGDCDDGLRGWRERVLCDAGGAFRLPLRWRGRVEPDDPGTERFTVTATERPGRAGQVELRLPEHLGAPQVIEINE